MHALGSCILPQHERVGTVLFYGRRYSYTEVSAFLKIPLTTGSPYFFGKNIR